MGANKKARTGKKSKQEKEEVVEEEDDSDQVESENSEESDDVDESDDDASSESGSESEGEEDLAAALFKGPKEESESEDDSEGEEHKEDVNTSSTAQQNEAYTFDLRNMLAINTDQLEIGSLYDSKKSKSGKFNSLEIPLDPIHGKLLEVNEDYLLSKATDGCSELIRSLWELPTEISDAGPLVTLPTYDEIRLPRAMPPPPPKQETKWEKFAKAKGIPLNKEKRSRKVWDEATGSWMYRHGYEKANKKENEWPIMEVGANDNPNDDPWEKQREEKRDRLDRNIERRMKNEEQAGNLLKGATNRSVKAREKAYEIGKEAGRKDSESLPVGVPVDLKNSNDPTKAADNRLRGKRSTLAALTAVQVSTASLGKFDRMREGEPERKKSLTSKKKRKFENPTDKKVITSEGQSSMKILNAVMNGGGVAKAKAIRKGQYAKGETAYDYDFNDGLGASSFKKKKGRAGAGKMKKMTKKRAK
eukprot:CAMPEP_0197176302 /NCGR_PEP_ID=MMETSP1423-20130617/2277_1 /TAXON_ID=476441 /ORGANISM="Pseudo-nitzschia heimii, Strain UNC1101" /LENGTH=474 /DNA_ID=CAMNT_0042625667 /DNA_START=47 /DNA_END=1471 /DNA_ORIENTATION=-